jgi:hypothetical protein
MLFQLTKNTGKPHIIKYIRDNGTSTWMYSDDFFVQHDLSHYAIEKTMGYKTAFNGMLNSGMDIKDFENREKRMAMNVTAESFYAENLANLFLMEVVQGDFEDFNAVQQQASGTSQQKFPVMALPAETINQVRSYLRQLLQQWNELPAGETMELIFSV